MGELLSFGDGNAVDPVLTVVSINPENDVVVTEAHIEHTYEGPGPFVASIAGCCRLEDTAGHINNPGPLTGPEFGSWRVSTVVDLSQAHGPDSNMAPVVDCPLDDVCSFTVPATTPPGTTVNYRLAGPAEASASDADPFTQPPGATIDPVTGRYTWDTTGVQLAEPPLATYYSTQVIVEATVDDNVVGSVAVDFFLRLGFGGDANQAPHFHDPTPADGTVIGAVVGDTITFDVNAEDDDLGDVVTTGVVGLPADASYTSTPGNPATGTFTWAPTAPGSAVLILSAQDQSGLGAVTRSVTINVTEPANQPPVALDDAAITIAGTPVGIDVLANDSDPDGDPVAVDSVTDATNGGTAVVEADGTITYTPAAGFTGTDDFAYTIVDGRGGDATATVTVTVEAADPPTPPTKPRKIWAKGSGKVGHWAFGVHLQRERAHQPCGAVSASKGHRRFRSTSVTSFTVVGNVAMATGTGKLDGKHGYRWTLVVVDRGHSTHRHHHRSHRWFRRDEVTLLVDGPNGKHVLVLHGDLQRGDIEVGEQLLQKGRRHR